MGLQPHAGLLIDAVLLIAFGGPEGPDDVRPFLANVLRGRRIAPERIEAVARHYGLFGGISPLNAVTYRQASGLAARLRRSGLVLPVYVGMRNWHPLLADTLRKMSRAGVRSAIGFIAAPHHSFSSCEQYRQNVADARRALAESGDLDVAVTFTGSWYAHPGFVETWADRVDEALHRLPPAERARARIVFTAHSIPVQMAERSRYREQIQESARLVAGRLGRGDWAVAYQSRSGRPYEPWLGPDICDYLRAERARGLTSVVICPLGFVSDHIEVLYDLDHEAARCCRELGLVMARAAAPNDHPVFLDMMADVVLETLRRYEHGRPLPIAPRASTP